MTREEFLNEFKKTVETMVSIAEKKNNDYAGDQVVSDAFANFTTVETLGITSTERGIMTRMTDKFCRIINLLKKEAQVKDETIEDTLLDLANYSIILKLYLEHKKDKKQVGLSEETFVDRIDKIQGDLSEEAFRDLIERVEKGEFKAPLDYRLDSSLNHKPK